MYQHNLQSINKEPSCYKNPNNPSCTDLFLTNRPRSFYQTETFIAGLSDFHKFVLLILKTKFYKVKIKRNNTESFENLSWSHIWFLTNLRVLNPKMTWVFYSQLPFLLYRFWVKMSYFYILRCRSIVNIIFWERTNKENVQFLHSLNEISPYWITKCTFK